MPRPGTALLAGALALAGIVPGASAHARAADAWQVPPKAWITLTGHGYGHGHGMSQYGAEGAARQGLDHREILSFYYPGTVFGSAGAPVQVLITADTSDDVEVMARPRLVVKDLAAGRSRLPDNGASRWRLTVNRDAATVVQFLTDRWRRWRVLAGDGEFVARGRPITLVTPRGSTAYRGRLRAASPAAGSAARDTVNVLSLEKYLRGVVPLEIPASWSPEAVRAQSVAARTYAAFERSHPRARHYQICDTTSCQVYGGVSAEHPASTAAIKATRRLVLTSQGRPAFTQFASSSGGWTSAASASYLPAKKDPYDGWSGNPVHDWSVRIDDVALERRWPAVGNLTGITVTRRDGNGEWGGRIRELRLTGSRGSVTITGDTFRSVLGLRSTWLTFAVARK